MNLRAKESLGLHQSVPERAMTEHRKVAGVDLNDGKIRLSVVLLAYISLALYFLFLNDFKYLIDPDVTSYISVAQKYLRGDYAHAINGHWSPLASWLAVPLLFMKIRPVLAFVLAAIIVGGFTLAGINLLMRTIGVRDHIRFLYGLSLSPLIAWYALTAGNPDLLSLCVLVYYLYLMMREGFKTNNYRGMIAGLLGAIAYLSKSYNFYFFLLHFTCFTFLYWRSSRDTSQRRTVLMNAFSGLLVFFLISGIWIGLLSYKYHTLTVSTAGDYNFSYIRPGSPGQAVDAGGLMPPPNRTAFSAWEDPTYIENVAWSPFQSKEDFYYFIEHTARNAATYLLYIKRKPVVFFTIVVFIVLLVPLRVKFLDNKPWYLFLTTLLQPIGYLMLYVEERYVWIDIVIFYILSAFLIDLIWRKMDVAKMRKVVFVSIICGYIAIWPIASFYYYAGAEVDLPHLKSIYLISRKISHYHDFRHANIASQAENWSDDLYLSYYLNARYFGTVKEGITDKQLKDKLVDYDVDYYFVHGTLGNHIDILKPEKRFGDLTIYKVVEPEDRADNAPRLREAT
jgi:hypothetical protein